MFKHKQPKTFAMQGHEHLDKLLMELVGGDRGGHADGDDGGGGVDEEEPVQRPLGWHALIGMFHRGVDEPLPFARGDVGNVDSDDGNP